jgi:adenylylsulfate kinase
LAENIFPHFDQMISREFRENKLGQRSKVIWLTGLSGSGKSTIGLALEKRLFQENFVAQLLDGDNIRSGINKNLGFSEEDRRENIRRIAEIAKLYLSQWYHYHQFIYFTHRRNEKYSKGNRRRSRFS